MLAYHLPTIGETALDAQPLGSLINEYIDPCSVSSENQHMGNNRENKSTKPNNNDNCNNLILLKKIM